MHARGHPQEALRTVQEFSEESELDVFCSNFRQLFRVNLKIPHLNNTLEKKSLCQVLRRCFREGRGCLKTKLKYLIECHSVHQIIF